VSARAPAGPPATGAGPRPPRVGRLRLVGPAAASARGRVPLPFGAVEAPDAEAYAVATGPVQSADLELLARALPDPDGLPAGALVFVLPTVLDSPSLASRVRAALGGGRKVTHELRATALVARGFVRVAAGVDDTTRTHLVWGHAPAVAPSPPPDGASVAAPTERG
jgi:hypothetical protein